MVYIVAHHYLVYFFVARLWDWKQKVTGVSKQSVGNRTKVNFSVCFSVHPVIIFNKVFYQENLKKRVNFNCLEVLYYEMRK